MALRPGLHETLITQEIADVLAALDERRKESDELSEETAADLLSRHLVELLRHTLRHVPKSEGQRVRAQLALANELVGWLATRAEKGAIDDDETVPEPGRLLRSLLAPEQVRLGAPHPPRPLIPLRQSDLLVNGPRDVRLAHLVSHELPSADRVDIIISFLKHSGLRVVIDALRRFRERNTGPLRVLTTTYMGATELRALQELEALGAEIRVSYDGRRTRLHAKSWIFHRESGFSTALVGSSNLSHAALVDGLEWNVRVSAIDSPVVFKKLAVTFDQYWGEGSFEPYQEARFLLAIDAMHRRDEERDAIASAIQPRPYPHQQAVLDAMVAERGHGYRKNLVVAATGTGKTVVAALDYARLRREAGEATLLFVAHREEILKQSLGTFRAVLGDGDFGRRLEPGRPLLRDTHVFASIQSLHAERLKTLRADAYDVVIVDELHHAAAPTYRALLEHLTPRYLIGLTATPERADGESVLGWFDGRIAAEIRLWDALDLGLLSPFQYFGVHDDTDLSRVDFAAGRYHLGSLEQLYTADDARALAVLRATKDKVRDLHAMKALGFCVSVRHAEFMAAFFSRRGVPALAVHGGTAKRERADALRALREGRVNALFTVDLFNEGVDVPAIDTVLFLRPTESATVFLQQLGRGLRIDEGKACLTVLDFIGRAHRRFRFDRRFAALLRGTRAEVKAAVEQGFPHLPGGCEILLDRESEALVLENIKASLALGKQGLIEDLAKLGDVGLRALLHKADVDLEDVYVGGGGYTALLHRAGLRSGPPPSDAVTRALPRLLHVDDAGRLDRWRAWLSGDAPPIADPTDPFQLMLFAALGHGRRKVAEMQAAWDELFAQPDLRRELAELFDELEDRRRLPTHAVADLPLEVHATYTRDEVTAALRELRNGKLLHLQGGVFHHPPSRSDLLFVTLEKDEKQFSPTTLYEDYPLGPDRFHWESQGRTRADSETGRRYRHHVERDWRIFLFVRRTKHERGVTSPFTFLGPVRYESHEREKPIRIVWKLERAMPPAFWNQIKVAAG